MNYLDIAEQTVKNGIESKRLNATCKTCIHCVHKVFLADDSEQEEFYQCKVPFNGDFIFLDKKPEDYCSDYIKKCSCNECTERHVGCHADCENYQKD